MVMKGDLDAVTRRMLAEVELEADRMRPALEVEADRIAAEAGRAGERAAAEQVAADQAEADAAAKVPRGIWREDYIGKDDEGRYLRRRADGHPNLYLVDAGDRLAVWSPIDGGGLINHKNPGIRRLGLYASVARGTDHYRNAYRAADLRKGTWVELDREPDNRYDPNAVALLKPGSGVKFGYVQRGRAAAVARRIDAGDDMAAVVLRGPGKGYDDETTVVLLGSRSDLAAMLRA